MLRSLALGAAVSATLFAVPALAADLPMEPAPAVVAVPSFSWTGFYVGAQVGYGWGESSRTTLDPKGALLGVYAGYNVQLDNSLVLGVETDFNWSDMDDKATFVRGGAAAIRVRARQDVDWAGATRGRIGFAFDRFLVYGAAGVAYAKREFRISGLRGGSVRDSKTAVGWTVGGGIESAVTDNVLVRAEYRYTDYGTDRFNLGGRFKSDLREHRVMAGVAYKF